MVPTALFRTNYVTITFRLVWMQVVCSLKNVKFNNVCIWTDFNTKTDWIQVFKQIESDCILNYSDIQLADFQFDLLGCFNFDWLIASQ